MTRGRLIARRATVLAVAFLAALSAAPSARADDLADLQGMLGETVVTTASKSAETGTAAPATSTTLTADDMRRYGIHSLDEAINFLALGVVTEDPLSAVDIGGRGVLIPRDMGDHFLLLVNGHAVNEPLLGTARFNLGLGIPIEMIDHVEVILGPGSVLYGSNAMLGVINVITKRAKDFHGTHVVGETLLSRSDRLSGGSSYRPTTYRASAGAGYEFPLFGTPSEATIALEYIAQDGPNFTFGPQGPWVDPFTNQGYRFRRDGQNPGYWGGVADGTYGSMVPSGQLRVTSGNFELNLHASTYKRSTPYRSRFTHQYNDFDTPGYELDRSLWADLKHHATLSAVAQVTTRIYADHFDYQDVIDTSQLSVCRYTDIRTCSVHYYGQSRWVGLELQTSLDWLKDNTFVTLLGVDNRFRFVHSKTDTDDFDTGRHLTPSVGVIDRGDHVLGAYVQQTWQPTPWLGFNGGARLDSENRFRGVVSPRLAATARAWKNGTLKGVYAEAFRAPTWQETNYSNPSVEVARGLVPERVRSVEASVEQTIGAHRLLFGLFRSWWSNLVETHFLTQQESDQAAARGDINQFTGSFFTQYRNVSSIDNYGLDASLSGESRDGAFRYGANFTATVANKFDGALASTPLAVGPHLFGNARLSYDLPGVLPTLALAGRFEGKRAADRAYGGEGFTPEPFAPAQVELRGAISGDVPKLTGLSYRLTATYAFASRGAYVVGPTSLRDLSAELVPVDQFRLGFGLQYDFLR